MEVHLYFKIEIDNKIRHKHNWTEGQHQACCKQRPIQKSNTKHVGQIKHCSSLQSLGGASVISYTCMSDNTRSQIE